MTEITPRTVVVVLRESASEKDAEQIARVLEGFACVLSVEQGPSVEEEEIAGRAYDQGCTDTFDRIADVMDQHGYTLK